MLQRQAFVSPTVKLIVCSRSNTLGASLIARVVPAATLSSAKVPRQVSLLRSSLHTTSAAPRPFLGPQGEKAKASISNKVKNVVGASAGATSSGLGSSAKGADGERSGGGTGRGGSPEENDGDDESWLRKHKLAPNFRELSSLQRTALVYALGTTTVAGAYWWYMRRIARHERRKGDHDHGHEQGAWAQRIPWSAERAKGGEGRANSEMPSAGESVEQQEHDPLPHTDTAAWGKTRMGGLWAERARAPGLAVHLPSGFGAAQQEDHHQHHHQQKPRQEQGQSAAAFLREYEHELLGA